MAEKIESVKFNISLKKQLFDRIEDYADELGLSRSGFIAFCCSQYMNAQDALKQMEQLTKLMKDIGSKSELSDTDKQAIRDMETVVRTLGCDVD